MLFSTPNYPTDNAHCIEKIRQDLRSTDSAALYCIELPEGWRTCAARPRRRLLRPHPDLLRRPCSRRPSFPWEHAVSDGPTACPPPAAAAAAGAFTIVGINDGWRQQWWIRHYPYIKIECGGDAHYEAVSLLFSSYDFFPVLLCNQVSFLRRHK